MKLALTAQEPSLDSPMDPRFGRAAYILIVDDDTLEVKILDNAQNVNAMKGAGIQAASSVCAQDVEVLMTGFCGPKAFKVLKAGGVRVVNNCTGTVRDAVKLFKEGDYSFADEATVQGHW